MSFNQQLSFLVAPKNNNTSVTQKFIQFSVWSGCMGRGDISPVMKEIWLLIRRGYISGIHCQNPWKYIKLLIYFVYLSLKCRVHGSYMPAVSLCILWCIRSFRSPLSKILKLHHLPNLPLGTPSSWHQLLQGLLWLCACSLFNDTSSWNVVSLQGIISQGAKTQDGLPEKLLQC